jgi:hypothetical protein
MRAGARVEVEILLRLPRDVLRRIRVSDRVAAAERPRAAARPIARFEDCTGVTGLSHLVGGGHSGDASAENDDAGTGGIAASRDRDRLERGRREKTHRVERAVECRGPGMAPDEVDESPTVDGRHGRLSGARAARERSD